MIVFSFVSLIKTWTL